MNKLAISLAVALLISNVSSLTHRKHDNMYLQFIDGEFDVESIESNELSNQAVQTTSVA